MFFSAQIKRAGKLTSFLSPDPGNRAADLEFYETKRAEFCVCENMHMLRMHIGIIIAVVNSCFIAYRLLS